MIATVAAPTVIKEPEKPAEGEAVEGAEGETVAEGAEELLMQLQKMLIQLKKMKKVKRLLLIRKQEIKKF